MADSRRWLTVVSSLLLVGASAVSGGVNRWTTTGPRGGNIIAVVLDPNNPSTVFAAGDQALFKSTDSGVTWAESDNGLPRQYQSYSSLIAVSGALPSLFSNVGNFIYRTTDGGNQWAQASDGFSGSGILAVDPTNPATLYVDYYSSVYKTTNSGQCWILVGSNVTSYSATGLAVDPSTPTNLYEGSGAGVSKSTDSGSTWSQTSLASDVTALALIEATPTILLAGTYGQGVFRSTDGGTTWSSTSLLTEKILSLQGDPSNPVNVYAGSDSARLFKSTDGGTSWTISNSGLGGDPDSIAVDPTNGANLYLGTTLGIFRSTDTGASWVQAAPGFDFTGVDALVIDSSSSPGTLYTGLPAYYNSPLQGVFKSLDSGASWQSTGLTQGPVYVLALDSGTPPTLYAGSDYGAVLKTTDAGITWSSAGAGLPSGSYQVSLLVPDPTNTSTLYASALAGLYKSTDAAATWSPTGLTAPNLPVLSLAIDPTNTSILYAGAGNYAGVFKSTDGGNTWQTIDNGLPAPQDISTIVTKPGAPTTLYLGCDDGIYTSTDAGATWVAAGAVQGGVGFLAIDPIATSVMYAGSTNLYPGFAVRSTDGGMSWQDWSSGLDGSNPQGPLVIDTTTTPESLHLPTSGGAFDYQSSGNPAPSVYSVSPSTGPFGGGTQITIGGAGFVPGGTVEIGGITAINASVANSSTIYATTPAHAPGVVSVVITNPDSQSYTLASGFTYLNSAPTVTSVNPSYGLRSGGTPVTITGTAFGNCATTVSFNYNQATNVQVIDPGTITALTPANYAGPATVIVTNADGQFGQLVGSFTFINFLDVLPTNLIYSFVNRLVQDNITSGCGNNNYCPEGTVARAQMAVFLLKAKQGYYYTPPPAVGIFADVPATNPFAPWIEEIYHEGVTGGCLTNPLSFCPSDPVTRSSMAVLLLREKHGSTYSPPPATGIFGDVPPTNPFAPWIEELYNEGITGGCSASPLLYCPDNLVTRGQMAILLVTTFAL